jgi:hypothetical protein
LAFSGATVHDMFNVLSVRKRKNFRNLKMSFKLKKKTKSFKVLILLPVEAIFSYLEKLSGALVNGLGTEGSNSTNIEILHVITKPLTNAIIQLDTDVLKKIASKDLIGNETLIKHICKKKTITEDAVKCKLKAILSY